MTQNAEMLYGQIYAAINTKFKDDIPTVEDISSMADNLRNVLSSLYPISDDEFNQIKRRLNADIYHKIGEAVTIRGADSNHKPWYFTHTNDGFYWERYKKYLRDKKHWSREIIDRLHKTTNDIMDDLGDPNSTEPFQRRGLLLGDVQSGKTSTYTAICNKAVDANYKVIIVLAGMMENLRIQTQERLDAEFVGNESKFILDKKADSILKNVPVGVGRIVGNDKKADKPIACFTSSATDFNKNTLKALRLSLDNLKGAALFVVKKNKSVLNNLLSWLTNTFQDKLIEYPLLLIDDEADNASVNTNSEEKEPTAINRAIRSILNCFKQASYLGITATPFANIFIDPDVEYNDAKDLFPRHFITVLPSPDLYIGADKIFGNGNADEWDIVGDNSRTDGEFSSALIPITNEEQANYFVFKHKKELADYLSDLPQSLYDAINYFVLINAISDYRNDTTEHRSMLVNVSMYTNVHNVIVELVENYIIKLSRDIEDYAQMPLEKIMQLDTFRDLYDTWCRYHLEEISNLSWEKLVKDFLFNAIRRIEVRAVNQKTGAKSLDYSKYKDRGLRVIAIGGNSLSRGLTLEGLCVSYFYRNTMMYDTLLQMGRWFGYRPNYRDLFKIWMGEDAIDWYGYITDAINELKDELYNMKSQGMTPEEFGLKVRRAPGALLVTARTKMRSAKPIKQPITVSGRLIETPRLRNSLEALNANDKLCREFIKALPMTYDYDKDTRSFIWRNVPKEMLQQLVLNFTTHPWSLNFQAQALADYIGTNSKYPNWDVAIPEGSSEEQADLALCDGRIISPHYESRVLEKSDAPIKNMLKVYGHHVRIGAGGCTKIGLKKEEIDKLRKQAKAEGQKINDSTYLIEDRNPIAMIHLLENSDKNDTTLPKPIFALGLGFPKGQETKVANYVVNLTELKNYSDDDYWEDDDDDIIS